MMVGLALEIGWEREGLQTETGASFLSMKLVNMFGLLD
jgi:hypothetical protein